jgi:hypothetical protein
MDQLVQILEPLIGNLILKVAAQREHNVVA